jgi:hypothetical protein
VTVASCAAIGGLGDYTEVDCTGTCGGDEGGIDASTPDVEQPETSTDGGDLQFGTVGGAVSGLTGVGLILQNNAADDLQIGTNGPFTFPTTLKTGDPYAVTVAAQPTGPAQTCSVSNGTGTFAGSNVTDVGVTCATAAYLVGGTVFGAVGTGLVLTNNGGDDKSITATGAFSFATKVASGGNYAVAVKTQPSGAGPCTVGGGTGTVGGANISSVAVNCDSTKYLVGGTVSGLIGTLVLQNNLGNDLTLTGNGTFAFSTPLAPSSAYSVTVKTAPAWPPRAQTCTITNGSGTTSAGGAPVTDVTIACTTKSFTIGGTVSGLTGTLVLKNNGGDAKTITANGAYTFATPVLSGATYAVTVGTQPAGQSCIVSLGYGTAKNANVTNVNVACGVINKGIRCDTNVYCSPSTQFCCFDRAAGKGTCLAKGTACADQPMACDDAADCSGGACCARYIKGNGNLLDVTCKANATLCVPASNELVEIWCTQGAINACAAPTTCSGTALTTPYTTCQ